MMDKRLLYIAIALAFALGAFVGLSLRRPKPGPGVEPEPQRDTTWLHDTVTVVLPTPKTKTPRDTVYLPAPVPPPDSTGHTPDTVYVPVPIETSYYAGDSYEAWVSGYRASLDSIRIHQETAIVEVPVEKLVTRHARWGIGVQAGATYLPGAQGQQGAVQPYVGLGISYNLITF